MDRQACLIREIRAVLSDYNFGANLPKEKSRRGPILPSERGSNDEMSERESIINDLSSELFFLEQEVREKGWSPLLGSLIDDIKKEVKGFNEEDKQFFVKSLRRHYAMS